MRPTRNAAALLCAMLAGLGSRALPAQTVGKPGRAPLYPSVEVYDSYPMPAACVSALERLQMRSDWLSVLSNERFDPARLADSTARAAAARCLARQFPAGTDVAKAPDRDVTALFAAGRGLADDGLAARALARALRQQRLRYDSASVFWAAASSYAHGLPARLSESQKMARWLDSLGVVGERYGLPQDSSWYSQHNSSAYLAQAIFDTAAMRAELAGARRNYAAVPKGALKGTEYEAITSQSTELLLTLVQHPRADSAVAALKARALQILGPHQEEGGFGGAMELLGDHFGPLHPDFWFNKNPADTLLPRKGRVTLVQYLAVHQCGCESMFATTQRLKQKFGDKLDILFLTQTFGHFNRQVQLEPADEARQLGQRLLETHKLPATVAVYRTTFVANPDPDSRLVAQPIAELRKVRFAGSALLVDRRGVFVLAGNLGLYPGGERALEALITSLLSAPAE
jgi:hypothetical protein